LRSFVTAFALQKRRVDVAAGLRVMGAVRGCGRLRFGLDNVDVPGRDTVKECADAAVLTEIRQPVDRAVRRCPRRIGIDHERSRRRRVELVVEPTQIAAEA
jgi:hypothetical protein